MTIGGKRGLNIGMGIIGADIAAGVVGSGIPRTPGVDPSIYYADPGNINTVGQIINPNISTPDYSSQDGTATWWDQANAYFDLLRETPTGVVQSSDNISPAPPVNISGPLMWTAVAAGFLVLMSAIGGKHR